MVTGTNLGSYVKIVKIVKIVKSVKIVCDHTAIYKTNIDTIFSSSLIT